MRFEDVPKLLDELESRVAKLEKYDYDGLRKLKAELGEVLATVFGEDEAARRLFEAIAESPLPHAPATPLKKWMPSPHAQRWDENIRGVREAAGQSRSLLEKLTAALPLLHPTIQKLAVRHFTDGDYKVAAFEAELALTTVVTRAVRTKDAGAKDDQGTLDSATKLGVFRLPHDEELDAQIPSGYAFIYRGAYMAIRNPKAHRHFQISSRRALHFLFVTSLLLEKCDEAKIDTRL